MLRLLESEGKAAIHSESEIMVLEGEQGKVWAGQSAYYTVETESTAGTTTSLETVELGSGLTVVPYYIGQQKIKINVEAQFKSLEDQVGNLPVILSRDSKTVVTLAENQPTFIAGVDTVSTRQIRKKLFEKTAQSKVPDRKTTDSQFVIFLEAERKNTSDSPLAVSYTHLTLPTIPSL